MSGSQLLNGTWGLTWAEGSPLMSPGYYVGTSLRGRKTFPAQVPAPIHQVLHQAGLLDDPNFGLNSLRARWVEEQFWIYRLNFIASKDAAEQNCWLTFERIELDATIWLNGEEVGTHMNAHRPASFNVTGKLRDGENLLVVLTSTGMHRVADKPANDYHTDDIGKLAKRMFRRTPQYQSGWDWSARLQNVGILGDVCLEWHNTPRLEQVTVFALPTPDLQQAKFITRILLDNTESAAIEAELQVKILETNLTLSQNILIPPGASKHEVVLALDNPQLWWPHEHGEQFRYTVEVTLNCVGKTQKASRKTGVRRVEFDQSPHPVEGQYCILTINNRPIFCKGGNWVPADLLYSTVDEQRTHALIDLAKDANFNLLRIWGGGTFVNHVFADYCDAQGILIWHDMLFACSKYPGDDPDFAQEVRKEITYQVRELAHHPSLVVWCGNNEIEWGDWDWGYDAHSRTHPHYALFHHDIPKIVFEEDNSTIHWISSPWSPNYQHPNSPIAGDQHPWANMIFTQGISEIWNCRNDVDRFPNEGGFLGVSSPATLKQFLPENEQFLGSLSWDHHDNSIAQMSGQIGDIGRAALSVEHWLGLDPLNISWEDYAFASSLLHAEGLCEYINNYRRRMFSSASAIFWMYNDSWPVIHGWTIVDYYLRKKLAYHPVRRAFQPISVVVAQDSEQLTIYGINDTPTDWHGELRYGIFLLESTHLAMDQQLTVTLAANTSTPLATFDYAAWQKIDIAKSGAFALLLANGRIHAQHRLFVTPFKELNFADPTISISAEDGGISLQTDKFAWGVCLDIDGESTIADNCFDLLPGIPYHINWKSSDGTPTIIKVGNRDAVAKPDN